MNPTRTEKIVYWVTTGYMLLLMLWAFATYHVINDMVTAGFERAGYPGYIVYPLAYLKLVAVVVIVMNRYNNLKEMVYGAYFINMMLAFIVHVVGDGFWYHAALGLIAVPVSYIYSNRVRGRPHRDLFVGPLSPQTNSRSHCIQLGLQR